MKNDHTNPTTPAKTLNKSGFTLLESLIMLGLLFIVSMITIALYLNSQNDKEKAAADKQTIEESAIDPSSAGTPPGNSAD